MNTEFKGTVREYAILRHEECVGLLDMHYSLGDLSKEEYLEFRQAADILLSKYANN